MFEIEYFELLPPDHIECLPPPMFLIHKLCWLLYENVEFSKSRKGKKPFGNKNFAHFSVPKNSPKYAKSENRNDYFSHDWYCFGNFPKFHQSLIQ